MLDALMNVECFFRDEEQGHTFTVRRVPPREEETAPTVGFTEPDTERSVRGGAAPRHTAVFEPSLSTARGEPPGAAWSDSSPGPRPALDTAELSWIGRVINGYQIVAPLGRGASAQVYRAVHVSIGKEAAIKRLSAPAESAAEWGRRMSREARALSMLAHPIIVAVLDFGQLDGEHYLTTELCDGPSLRALIEREGSLAPARALSLARDIAAGLAAAHAAGVVHRDLKPANVMVTRVHGVETAKLLDFGLARILSSDLTRLTTAGRLLGTPQYMAPEQVLAPADAGPQADVYALGCVLYRLLSGRLPFQGEAMELLEQHVHRAPPPLGEAPELAPLVMAMMDKSPERRPSAAEAMGALQAALERQRAELEQPTATTRAPAPRSRLLFYLGAGALICAGLAIGFSLADGGPPPVLEARMPAVLEPSEAPARAAPSATPRPVTEEAPPAAQDGARLPLSAPSRAPRRPRAMVEVKESAPRADAATLQRRLRRVADRLSQIDLPEKSAAVERLSARCLALGAELRALQPEEDVGLVEPRLKALEAELEALATR